MWIAVFENRSGFNLIRGNRVELGTTNSAAGISIRRSNNVVTSNNAVQIGFTESVGIEHSGGSNMYTDCNQISRQNNENARRYSSGILVQDNVVTQNSCNYLNGIEWGLQIAGVNTTGSASYTRNTFDRGRTGIAVGFSQNGQSNQIARIGDPQLYPDNVWLNDASPAAEHYANDSWKPNNRFNVRNVVNYFPTTGDIQGWFFSSFTQQPIVACPTSCAILPPGWLTPPDPCELGVEDMPSDLWQVKYHRAKAIYRTEEWESSNLDKECSENTNCYLEGLALEDKVLGIGSASDTESDYTYRRDQLVTWLAQSEEDENLPAYVESYLASSSSPQSESEQSLDEVLVELNDFLPCDPQTELWIESMELHIKQYSNPESSALHVVRLQEIAEKCSVTEGPGVSLARTSLGSATSDVSTCTDQSLDFRLRRNSEGTVYPNPASAGSYILLSTEGASSAELYSTEGQRVAGWSMIKGGGVTLPEDLFPGIYILTAHTSSDSQSFRIVVGE